MLQAEMTSEANISYLFVFSFFRLVPDTSESELSDSDAFDMEIFPAPEVTRELLSSDEDWLAKLLVDLAFSRALTASRKPCC